MEIIPSSSSPSPSPSSSSSRFKLFDQLELQEFNDKYVIKSVESPNRGFSISRLHGDIQSLNDNDDESSVSPSKTSAIYGVVGTYMLVIISRKEVGTFLGFPVFRITAMKFLPCNDALKFSTTQEKRDEAYFMNLLKVVESTPGLYYSYETDMTLNVQRRCKLAEGWMSKPLWKTADPRFVWNKNLLDELIEFKLKLKESSATVTLLSRRCTRRLGIGLQGTRMWRRGANLEGDTANFIETEQLLELEGYRSSFLQIRGSIPLLWEQIVDLSYRPRLRIINHEQMSKVVERHFHDLYQRYGDTIAVDLTNKHGDEGQLSMAYAAEMQKLPNNRIPRYMWLQCHLYAMDVVGGHVGFMVKLTNSAKQVPTYQKEFAYPSSSSSSSFPFLLLSGYVSFDFHHFCGNSNFDNLQILYDQISDDFQKQGYLLIDPEGNILEEQNGIFRSNCIDCLDRSNVTQSFLGQKSLTIQLQRIGVLTSIECISMFIEEYGKFRTLWAEQGDEVSLEYAGTHALKGDLVRYGKQTIGGIIKDGMSALSRYYLNNFQDGVRQDALDLISGRYSVNRNDPSPFQLNGFESFSGPYTVVQSGGRVIHTIANSTEMHVQDHSQNHIFRYLEGMSTFMSSYSENLLGNTFSN
ncbi:unnamed protein product [Dovyalis caffra]|uniref:SAC domain-containing protein n=1 Tax=Dovyalis caffra TaxID=77055 RepID=A0AAV1S3P1_9ROSI|nr:unnamed protein product [Dovyalis caffra]